MLPLVVALLLVDVFTAIAHIEVVLVRRVHRETWYASLVDNENRS